ncbi:MAG: hypothetical protein AAF092_07800 [Pseudomonadota bacterium]
MTSFAGIDVRLWQALIAGGVVALGWVVTGWRNRAEARALKAEKLRDAHKALFAEIRTTLSQFSEGGREVFESALEEMRADADFVPFIPKQRHDLIFGAMVPQLDVLPRATIDEIVAYYSVIGSLAGLADDMRGEGFKAMSQTRRIALYEDYAATHVRAFRLGELALAVIAGFADGGHDAARAAADRINSSAGDRGVPPGAGAGD